MPTRTADTPETLPAPRTGEPMLVIGSVDLPARTHDLLQEYAAHIVTLEIEAGTYPVVVPSSRSRSGSYASCYVLVTGTRRSRFASPGGGGPTETVGDAELLGVIDYCGRGHVRWPGYAAFHAEDCARQWLASPRRPPADLSDEDLRQETARWDGLTHVDCWPDDLRERYYARVDAILDERQARGI